MPNGWSKKIQHCQLNMFIFTNSTNHTVSYFNGIYFWENSIFAISWIKLLNYFRFHENLNSRMDSFTKFWEIFVKLFYKCFCSTLFLKSISNQGVHSLLFWTIDLFFLTWNSSHKAYIKEKMRSTSSQLLR